MRKLVVAGLVLALGVTALALAGGGAARSEKEPYKVAFIYPGPHNDQGWSQAHDRGRLAIEKALGDKVQTTYKENVFSNASVPQIVAGLVREGYNMIVGCSFGMFENGVNGQLYKKYPDVLFEQATGTQIKKNQAEYFGAGEDTIYLSGMAAGAASKKGLIGYVVPFGIPEVVRHTERIRARRAGDASRCEGQADLDERVVLTAQGSRGREEPHRGGCRRHRPERGQSTGRGGRRVEGRPVGRLRLERAEVGAEAVADGGDIQLGPVLREARKAAINGTWKPGFYYGSIKDGFTSLAPYGPKVSAKTKAAIAAKRAAMVSGKFNVFTGPIVDQAGKVVVPAGKTPKVLPDLYSMQWLVKGVVGKVSTVLPPG